MGWRQRPQCMQGTDVKDIEDRWHLIRFCLCLWIQAAAGAFGMTGLMGAQATGSWADMQNAAAAAASFYQRQAAGLGGSPASVASVSSFDPSSSSKIRGMSYRNSVWIAYCVCGVFVVWIHGDDFDENVASYHCFFFCFDVCRISSRMWGSQSNKYMWSLEDVKNFWVWTEDSKHPPLKYQKGFDLYRSLASMWSTMVFLLTGSMCKLAMSGTLM